MIEVASGDYPRDLDGLAQAAENLALKRSICLDKNDNADEKGRVKFYGSIFIIGLLSNII